MDKKCGSNVCNRIIAELDDIIQCDGGCKQRFHIKCSTVSPNAIKYMTASKNLKFLCDECLQYSPSLLNAKYETMLNLMNEILAAVKTENIDLKNKFDDLKNKQWIQKPVENKSLTLADIIKSGSNSCVLIKPKNIEQKSDITKTVIKDKICPTEIAVNGIRKVGKGAIIVECTNKEASEKLIKKVNENLSESYEIKETEAKKPKLKIIGLSTKDDDNVIVDFIKSQNVGLENSEIKVVKVFQNHRKNGYNCIIQVDGETFKKLMNEQKIFIGWDRCRVTECVDLLRCYNCSGFQHKSSECKRDKACPRCAQNHDLKECKQEKRECANCKFAVQSYHLNLDVDHEAWSPECPTFLRKLNVQRSKIAYDQ